MRCISVGDIADGGVPDCDACCVAHGESEPGDRHAMADAYADGDSHPTSSIDANGDAHSIPNTAARSDAGAVTEPCLSQ